MGFPFRIQLHSSRSKPLLSIYSRQKPIFVERPKNHDSMATNQPLLSTHLPLARATQTANNMIRQDSATGPTPTQQRLRSDFLRKSRLQQRRREAQIRFIMERGQRQGQIERQRTKDRETSLRNARVPVDIQIEHCAYVMTADVNGRQNDKPIRSICRRSGVETHHAPFEGINAATFAETRDMIRKVYDAEFGRFHESHLYSCHRARVLVMELHLRHNQSGMEMKFSEETWMSVLGMLAVNHLPAIQNGRPAICTSTLVARFTCPAVGKSY